MKPLIISFGLTELAVKGDTLSATESFCHSELRSDQLISRSQPIILKPVDKNWDCGRLMAERDRLFPPTPTVDW